MIEPGKETTVGKLDKINEQLSSINTTLAAQHVTLVEHVRRTELLENKVAPIERHVNYVEGAFKFIALIGIVIGIWESLKRLL